MARTTIASLSADVRALTTIVADLATIVAAQAPAKSAPVQASAAAPLYVSDKPRCAIHDACTRKLSDPSASHVACAGKDDPNHAKLRVSHRHF